MMKPELHSARGAVVHDRDAAVTGDALLRRLNKNSEVDSVALEVVVDGGSSVDFAGTPGDHCGLSQTAPLPQSAFTVPARDLARRCCPARLRTLCAALRHAWAEQWRHCVAKAAVSTSTSRAQRSPRPIDVVHAACVSCFRPLRVLSVAAAQLVGHVWRASTTSDSHRPRRRRLSRSSSSCCCCRRYILMAVLIVFLATAGCGLCFMSWVHTTLMADPLADMRIKLSVAYAKSPIDEILFIKRGKVKQHPTPAPNLYASFQADVMDLVDMVRRDVEDKLVRFLAARYARDHDNAPQAARALMADMVKSLKRPVQLMMGDTLITRNTLQYSGESLVVEPADGTTVGTRMMGVVRSAMRRCTHGVPTLSVLHATPDDDGELPVTEAIFDSLWSAFVHANATMAVYPQCLARSQRRMPCADVGITEDGVVAGVTDAAAGERSRVQHLYEHGARRVDEVALAQLYYDMTPGLSADAQLWRAHALHRSVEPSMTEPERYVRVQQERFLRSAPTATNESTRAVSGVILILSGAADRNPEGRDSDFTQHALPLLEKNFLKLHPHYPVHVFYEAPSLPSAPAPVWTLRDVLRHSDVYTVQHSWPAVGSMRHGSNGQRIHIAPPPPVLVDAESRLPAMRAQQTKLRSWFGAVASRVPSAPYVTFENVAPLFSTLPCGVTEEDVKVWASDPRTIRTHGRGYRQMCRFWARLVWHLPSLRVWTDSGEGLSEAAAFAGPHASLLNDTTRHALPPWRYRYTYYFRLDTDSYLHRAFSCDPFVAMTAHRCAYGYNSIVRDIASVTMHLGSAMAEWMAQHTSAKSSERERGGANGTRVLLGMGSWGRLSDPSLSSLVTLVAPPPPPSPLQNTSSQPPLPPLPPTWPWYNVYPEHSSTALSAAETDVLRTFFFEGLLTREEDEIRQPQRYTPWGVKKEAMLAERLPAHYAPQSSYNRVMYYNNFELGTFGLKNHPLYTSATEFFDNRDYDDVTGPEREAAAFDYTLLRLQPNESPHVTVPLLAKMKVYMNPVYRLHRRNVSDEGEGFATGAATANPQTPREQCRGRRAGNYSSGGLKDRDTPARDVQRDWRSGYLQYRWGDAPVHTFAAEVVLQREGWSVCQFNEAAGLYQHGRYTPL